MRRGGMLGIMVLSGAAAMLVLGGCETFCPESAGAATTDVAQMAGGEGPPPPDLDVGPGGGGEGPPPPDLDVPPGGGGEGPPPPDLDVPPAGGGEGPPPESVALTAVSWKFGTTPASKGSSAGGYIGDFVVGRIQGLKGDVKGGASGQALEQFVLTVRDTTSGQFRPIIVKQYEGPGSSDKTHVQWKLSGTTLKSKTGVPDYELPAEFHGDFVLLEGTLSATGKTVELAKATVDF